MSSVCRTLNEIDLKSVKIVCGTGISDTDENAAKLQQQVVEKAKEITDVFSAFGGWKPTGPFLQQSVDDLMQVWLCISTA